ncbi:hypothetical protein UFOVP1491_26 [uncultured Caudovirales phage]|uniref:Uncharacterized protein n=1 Tax=uncultured Caudovirales phage TaxID=2100421 RepID=A0A6J5Q4N8_9CAUD|nr:hypothetical protein UFOVP485_95 [uncultured Caudovirales phage]CAB4150901.1 hypothetical protein UFOVP575_47 [uncultured Caudovirales phage]CAB4175067.1 hypothetical protein UFOVP963_113 [uncultured Caudovirales phage]CAB4179630.1 hypothetical protein UFOVP1032_26 [uncultured Caudovirales phage]CAB4185714.1 hypothetical protein UFOVP1125_94 [uncultured Caudovirales phage]
MTHSHHWQCSDIPGVYFCDLITSRVLGWACNTEGYYNPTTQRIEE